MKQLDWKSMMPHLIAIAVFLGISLAYFSPVLEGKKLYQSDKVNFIGMSKEIKDHRASHYLYKALYHTLCQHVF